MRWNRFSRLWLAALLGVVRLAAADPPAAPSDLKWQTASNRVDARISGWPLTKVLGRVSRATGWEVFVEPGQDTRVNATFTDLPPREALGRLLGNLSFSLQPQPGGPARLYVYRSERGSATQRIEDVTRPGRIPNELIVRLKPGSKISIEELARQLGGRVLGKMEKFNAYRLQFDTPEAAEAARRKLAELGGVASIEDNFRWESPEELAPGRSAATSGGASTLRPKLNPDGKYLVVGIIDTAAQPLAADREALILSRTDIVSGQPTDDSLWHGTAMAETFFQGVGVTGQTADGTEVRVRLYNAFGDHESATSFDVARAVVQAAQDGATMVSTSLGGPERSPLLDDTIDSFVQQGGLVFASAGNDGSTRPFSPSANQNVISVTGTDQNGELFPWSNRAPTVDVAVPGVSYVPYNNLIWKVTGTSPATALAAGMAAGYVERTDQPLSTVRPVLEKELPFKSSP